MDRKTFLKKTMVGAAILMSTSSIARTIHKRAKDKVPFNSIGFNHLPNTKSTIMKNSILHKSESRGHANHGWLNSRHTFSFANYYNPERMNFGVLRVLNDDIVAPGRGFSMHQHSNMEIISIPLEGDLEHKDSMGNLSVIKAGDVQVMSAGTGIYHSEYNKNKDSEVKFLQIWLYPNSKNVVPRYDQVTLSNILKPNQFNQILSPNADSQGVWIHQEAWFHIGLFDANYKSTYTIHKKGNGLYLFIIEGEIEVDGQRLESRDGYGIWDVNDIHVTAITSSRILVMEVPILVDQ